MDSNSNTLDSSTVTDIDNERMRLKEERKLRNKLKQETKKLQRQKERKNKEALCKMQSRGSNVTVITRDFADQLAQTQVLKAKPSSVLRYEDFPALGSKYKPKHEEVQHDQITCLSIENKSKKKSSSIRIDMMELITAERKTPYISGEVSSVSYTDYYTGNTLDSDLPKRMQGKHREVPKLKKPTKLKRAITYDNEVFEKFNINLDDDTNEEVDDNQRTTLYCDNIVTQELLDSVQEFIRNVVNLQEKLYMRNQLKGKIKKRHVVGFNEVKKYLNLNKMKLIVIATDIKVVNINDALGKMINTITELASLKSVPYVFALKRRLLGRLTLKNIPVSCMGVLNYVGLEVGFHTVLENISETKRLFIERKSEDVQINEVNERLLENLKNALA